MEHEEIVEIQDKPLFVCQTVIDVNAQMEASKAAMGKTNLISNLVMYGMCLIMAAYMVMDSIQNDHWKQNALMLGLIALVAVFVFFSRNNAPKKAMARWEEAIIKKYGTNSLHLTTEFYEMSLAQSLREDEEQFVCDGYSSIKELKETENLFLLRHSQNQYYFIDKKGFTTGTADQFRSFIQKHIGGK
ncbi:MAG: YcxB family protein [Oscillospiraceae bacterium]|nr:YcxB family protein [Oscillospiraceae bacterium]